MTKFFKVSLFFIFCILLSINALSFNKTYKEISISFTFQSDTLKGVLVLPKKKYAKHQNMPLAIFVHGDGAINKAANGYYKSIWNELTRNGIACMSWDKKGVGESTGNWLCQTMEDRALEAIEAIKYAKCTLGFKESSIGLIGFSQAGWVVPKVSTLSDYPDFMVIVSPAINWKSQSNYLTQKRLERMGADSSTIDIEVKRNENSFKLFNENLSYTDYVLLQDSLCEIDNCPKMNKERYYFIQKNIESDAIYDIKNISCPLFVVHGDQDLNVDYKASYDTYKNILSQNKHRSYKIKVYSDGTHGLLKSKYFNVAKPNLMFLIKLKLLKKKAFVGNFIEDVAGFILSI